LAADHASRIYVRRKARQAAVAGLIAFDHFCPDDTTQSELLDLIARLNADQKVHGILVQLPLPRHLSLDPVLQAIDPAKDIDGFHPLNRGRLAAGLVREALLPCTPLGCLMMLRQELGDLSGREAVIVGRSHIVRQACRPSSS